MAKNINQISIDGDDGVGHVANPYPPSYISNGATMWCGHPIKKLVRSTDFIFEGEILSDSIISMDSTMYDYNKILILKQLKGTFTSDTIIMICPAGYTRQGDEAIFWANKKGNIIQNMYGYGCGFIIVCDKKDYNKGSV